MTQLLESVGDLNLNLRSGFNIVAACSDNWRQSMRTQLTTHDNRLSKLENTLSTLKSSIRTAQATSSEIAVEQRRISTMVYQNEDTIRNLNQETLESGRRAEARASSVESRMGGLGNRIEEIRNFDMNARIPPGVIQSLNNTIMDGAPSIAVELLSLRKDELTQEICIERIINTDFRIDVSELQEKINELTQVICTEKNKLEAESLRNKLELVEAESLIPVEEGDEIRVSQGGIKAREWEIVRKKIDKKFSSNGDLPDLISF